jgi:protein-tyrosine sulfotransferase
MQNYIFIGGASRSGTSVLVRLFDWHPEIFVFPIETPVLAKYWSRPENERELYFRERFFEPGQGKHVQFVDAKVLEAQKLRQTQQLGKESAAFDFDVDGSAFLSQYQEALQAERPLLDRIFKGLGHGLRNSSASAKQYYESVKYLLFKDPYYTELYAQGIGRLLPNSKFIHLVRSPLARYVSAKKRWFDHKRVPSRKNGLDFATSLCETWVSSRRLAEDNLQALGSDRYRIVYYENLLNDPEQEMRGLAQWLDVEFTGSLLSTTMLGKLVASPNSSFSEDTGVSASNAGKVDASVADRQDIFLKTTSVSERSLIYYLVGTVDDLLDDYKIPRVEPMSARFLWMLPFQSEPRKAYLRRILSPALNPTMMPREKLAAMLFTRLPALVREGKAQP